MPNKARTLLIVKLAVSVALILWITSRVDLPQVWVNFSAADPFLLVVAFAMFFLGYVLTAFRWRTLIRSQGSDATVPQLVRSFMVGIFFNNFLPSTVGGDVVRMYDSWRIVGSKSIAFTVVFVDRFLGVIALLGFASVALMLDEGIAARLPFVTLWMILIAIGTILLCYLMFWPGTGEALVRLAERFLAGNITGFLKKIMASFKVYARHRRALRNALGLSVLLQINVVLHYTLLARSVGIVIPIESMFLVVPIAVFVMMVPISINAIGVREAIFVFIFSQYGVAEEQSLLVGLIAYGFSLLQGILGGVVFALRRYT